MKYKLIIFLLFFSCTNLEKNKTSFFSKGFAYIYNDIDYDKKNTLKKFNNEILSIGHDKIKAGTLLKIINPLNKKEIILSVEKKTKYPDFYHILITEPVADFLKLDRKIPFVEIQEIKKNKSFVASKAKTFKEEKKVAVKAPIANVKIDNISKYETIKKSPIKKFSIVIGEFYSVDSVRLLKKRLSYELKNYNQSNIKIIKKSTNNFQLLSGPYNTINSLKNDYIDLKKFGFEDLNIKIYE
jgi:hypothetical protein